MASEGLPQHDRPWLTALGGTTAIPAEYAMSGSFEVQFDVIRMIAASLIAVAIVLLWFVVMSRQ
jgi:heme/copper-type cytochrome/quinol oxidase subunit 4